MPKVVVNRTPPEQPGILIVASRDPGGPRTGRKAVIATIIRSLQALGYPLEVAVVARKDARGPASATQGMHACTGSRLPARCRSPRNLVGFARGRMSLNECLFFSQRGAEKVRAIAAVDGLRARGGGHDPHGAARPRHRAPA